MTARSPLFLLAALLATLCTGCLGPGVEAGSPDRGWVVWGFVADGPSIPASGRTVAFVDASGEAVEQARSNWLGRYTLAHHPDGQYVVEVGELRMPVSIVGADQRLDIDLSREDGRVDHVADALDELSSAAEAAGAGAGSGAIVPVPAAEAANRDPQLPGHWSRTDSYGSGDASFATSVSMTIQGDGTFTHTVGDMVGGGAGWSAESRGDSVTTGKWKTADRVLYLDEGDGWQPYADYYVEDSQLMLTFDGDTRQIWYR